MTQIVGWNLTVGSVLSFMPQIYILIKNKKLDGLSALTWTLNLLSSMNTAINALILYWSKIQCCQHLPLSKCIQNIVPLAQLISPAICILIICSLVAYYSDRLTEQDLVVQSHLKTNLKRSVLDFIEFVFRSYSFVWPAFIAALILLAVIVGVGAALMVFKGINNHATIFYADAIGISAVFFLVIMYIPQLYTTFKAKHQGSLSLVTLFIQAPGSLAIVYFDAVQNHLSWTSWVPFLVSAIQQFILITMCIYYYIRNRKSKSTGEETESLLISS